MSKRSVLIIYTGGTIGMVKSTENNSLVPMDFSNIRLKVPELNMFDFDVLEKLSGLDVEAICPLHGPVLKGLTQ